MASLPASNESAGPAAGYAPQGTHWLVDCHGVEASRLTDLPRLEALLVDAALAAGARILFRHFHHFGGDDGGVASGVTGVVLLAESHITIHTWPEHGFAALDLFLCGTTRPERAVACLEAGLEAARVVVHRQQRGAAPVRSR